MTAVIVMALVAALFAAFAVAGFATICDGTSCEFCGDECDEPWPW